ncbi:MAG: hypothetical protein OHK0012_08410 [Synechococcales cyanobacterium]
MIKAVITVLGMGFHFTTDWFSPNIPLWQQHLSPYVDRPVQALEIGSWEGRSAVWLLENILTHPDSVLTCVDTFQGSAEHDADLVGSLFERFQHNITLAQTPAKVIVHSLAAQDFFQTIPQQRYDVIYVDGSHFSWDVLTEAIHCWPRLNLEGTLIFDDYLWEDIGLPYQQPKVAIDAFLQIFQDKLQVLAQDYQVVIRKRSE